MKLVFIPLVLTLIASCGQESSTTRRSSQTKETDECLLNGRSVSCSSIQGADGLGIDLLESVVDVPVKIQESEITFLDEKSSLSTGRRINCKTAVRSGEIYRYALRGERLLLMTEQGSFEMDRISDGSGISGAWMWRGYVDQGTHVIRNITFLGNNRAILRTNCEL